MSTSEAGIDLALDDLDEVAADDVQEFLPGLGSEEVTASPLESAVMVTLREYAKAGLLRPRDAGKVALSLDLTRVMAIKRRSGRTSTYSNDARLLFELLDSFVAEETAGDAAVTQAMQEWSELLAESGLGRRSSEPAA